MAALPGIPHDSSDESSDFELLHPTEADDYALSEEAGLETSMTLQQAEREAESETEASEVESVPLDAAPEASDDDDDGAIGDGGSDGEDAASRRQGAEGPPVVAAVAAADEADEEDEDEKGEAEVEKQEEPEPAPEDDVEEQQQRESTQGDDEEEAQPLPQQPRPQPPEPAAAAEAVMDADTDKQELEAVVRRLRGSVRLLAFLCMALALTAALASGLAAYAWSSRNECIKSRQLTSLVGFSQDKFIRPMGSLPSSLFNVAPESSRLSLNRMGMGHATGLSRASPKVEEKPPQKLQAALVNTDWLISRLNLTASLNVSLQERRLRSGRSAGGLLGGPGAAGLGRPGLLWEKEMPRARTPTTLELRAALERKDSQIDRLRRSAASKDAMIESLRDLAVSLRSALQEQHRAGASFKADSERKDVVIQSLNKTSSFMQVLLEKQYHSGKGCACGLTKVRSRQLSCAEEPRPQAAFGMGGDGRGLLQFKLIHDNKVVFTLNLTVASLEKKLRARGTYLGRLHGDMLKVALPQRETLLQSLGAAAAGVPPIAAQPPCAIAAALLCPPTSVSSRGLCGPSSLEASAGGRTAKTASITTSINLPAQFIHTPLIEGMLRPEVRKEPFVRSALGSLAKLAPVTVSTAQRMKVAPQQMQPGRRVLSWPAPTTTRSKEAPTCDSKFLSKACANALGECRAEGDQSNENLDGCSGPGRLVEHSIETRRAASRAEEETTWRLSIARMFRTMTSEMQLPQPREEQAYVELWPLSRAASFNRTSTAPTKAGRASLSFPLLARSRMS
mmetsp:Transcript_77672/g.195353  ORF Transcript_77672/g.195353 Transcript_77672/m.195353 type:complete len:791 (-) Transcript_77672:477-2849(-)